MMPIPMEVSHFKTYKVANFLMSILTRTWLRLEVTGQEWIPPKGGVIVAANHQSFLDVPILGFSIPRESRFPGKAELFLKEPWSRLLLKTGGFPLARGEGDRKAVSFSQTLLEMGIVLSIFPEGTRTRTGKIGSFHRGMGLLAIKSNAAIGPAAIWGTGLSMGQGKTFPRPGRIKVAFSAPILPWDLPLEEMGHKEASIFLSKQAEDRVKALYETIAPGH
jgi:1-acyl-sn-glycerol-3-phosphate acyltransferase